MSRNCPECGAKGSLKILGTSGFDDLIEVECSKCGEFFELEPDGLGEGGLEWVEAKIKDEENES